MREQVRLGFDCFKSRSSEEELPAGGPAAVGGGIGRQPVPERLVTLRLRGCFLALARLSLLVLLLSAVIVLAAPATSQAGIAIGISVGFAPPALPIYVQPLCPGPGYIWIPGYWAWDPDIGDYYWVPGVWVLAPFVGALWTPGYWGWSDGVYGWYDGYWGPVVGFYGGINYGFGYTGFGYDGGYWRGGSFYYNKTVNNINVTNITNVYSKTVSSVSPAGVSFNGGTGGTTLRPTSAQLAAASQKRLAFTDAQRQQMQAARVNPNLRAAVNHGRPAIAATTKPGVFKGSGVVRASKAGALYKPPTGGKAPTGGGLIPKTGTERPRVTAPERRITEPRTAPRKLETTKPSKLKEMPKGEKGGVSPRVIKPERRITEPGTRGPGTTTKPPTLKEMPKGEKGAISPHGAVPERRVTEPHAAPHGPVTTKPPTPSTPKGAPKGEKELR